MWWIIRLSSYCYDIDEFKVKEDADIKLEELKKVKMNGETLCLVQVNEVIT